MKATISMESLWQTIQTLSLSNRKWLAAKLQDDINREQENRISKEELLAAIDTGLKEVKMKREGKIKTVSAREFLNELKDESQN